MCVQTYLHNRKLTHTHIVPKVVSQLQSCAVSDLAHAASEARALARGRDNRQAMLEGGLVGMMKAALAKHPLTLAYDAEIRTLRVQPEMLGTAMLQESMSQIESMSTDELRLIDQTKLGLLAALRMLSGEAPGAFFV